LLSYLIIHSRVINLESGLLFRYDTGAVNEMIRLCKDMMQFHPGIIILRFFVLSDVQKQYSNPGRYFYVQVA